MAINYNGNSVKVINYAEKNHQPNDVKKVIKDGVVVWCKPYTAYVQGDATAVAEHGSIMIKASQEPTAVLNTTFTSGEVYYGDTVQCTWKEGIKRETASVNPTSLTLPTIVNDFHGYYFGCKVTNTLTVPITIYYRWVNTPRGGGAPSYDPTGGTTYYNKTIAAGATVSLQPSSFNVSNSTNAYMYYYCTCTQTTTYNQQSWGPNSNNPIGLSNVQKTSYIIEDGLYQYIATGTKTADGLVRLNVSYILSNPTSTKTLRNPSTYTSFTCTT